MTLKKKQNEMQLPPEQANHWTKDSEKNSEA
jgi:hypothetical protein